MSTLRDAIYWIGLCGCIFLLWRCDSDRDRQKYESDQAERDAYIKGGFRPEYHWDGMHWVKP